MFMVKKIPLIFLSLIMISCSNNKMLEMALDEADDNRTELLKVINHYSKNNKDSLKLKAAIFLISNLKGHHTKTSAALEYMTNYFNNSDTIISDFYKIREKWLPYKGKKIESVITYDLNNIKADFLIDNIDSSYDTWINSPWKSEVSFDDYCNYILPYRFEDEPLTKGWRDSLRLKYGHIIDNEKNIRKAFAKLKRAVWHRTQKGNTKFSLLTDVLAMEKQGVMNCRQGCVFLGDIARSLGIPVVIDKVYSWANYSKQGHNWLALSYNGNTYTVVDDDTIALRQAKIDATEFSHECTLPDNYPINANFKKRVSKIYRQMFRNVKGYDVSNIKWKFMDSHVYDVSHDYFLHRELKLHVSRNIDSVYLCTFLDSPYWAPVACEKNEGGKVSFMNLGDSIIYLPMKLVDKELIPLTHPILFYDGNKQKILKPNKERRHSIVLTRKYPFSYHWINKWNKMKGSCFEVSNDFSFANKKILYTIEDIPLFRNTVYVKSNEKFRFIRYKSNENTNLTMSEIQFFYGGRILSGKSFGNMSIKNSEAFDGNFSNCDENKTQGYYVGMDFGIKENVSRIEFYPLNDGNFIVPNMKYELFYYDFGWKSLGKKASYGFELQYDSVPQNAVLLLRNITNGNEERIFTYENEKQIWW